MTLPMIPSTLMPDPWPATIHPSIEHAVDEGDGLVQRQRYRRDPLALGARTASISRRISALPPLARVTAMDVRPPRLQILLAGRHHGDHGLPVVHHRPTALKTGDFTAAGLVLRDELLSMLIDGIAAGLS
jgi:hypothetical protein